MFGIERIDSLLAITFPLMSAQADPDAGTGGPEGIPRSGAILGAVLDLSRSFVILCDGSGIIGYANPAALRLFGRAASAFETDGLFDMPTSRKDRQALAAAAGGLMMNERKRLEMVLRSIEGLHVPAGFVLCRIEDSPEGQARILVIGDPADAIATASYVSSVASNNLVVRMLHGGPDPVFLLDPRTRIVRDCNLAAAALFGWSRDAFIGGDLRKLFPDDESFASAGARAAEFESLAGIHEDELSLRRSDGEPISCKLTSLCIFGAKGDAELRVAVLHDVTEAHIREDMLDALAARSSDLAVELNSLTKHQVPIGMESLAGIGFTESQARLARYAAIGLTTKEMALRLGITESTVKSHFSSMFRKYGVASRVELVALLSERRILEK